MFEKYYNRHRAWKTFIVNVLDQPNGSAVLSETTHTHCPPEVLLYFLSSALRGMEFGETASTFAIGTEINVRLQILPFYLKKPIFHQNGGTKLVQFLLYD